MAFYKVKKMVPALKVNAVRKTTGMCIFPKIGDTIHIKTYDGHEYLGTLAHIEFALNEGNPDRIRISYGPSWDTVSLDDIEWIEA